MKMLTGNCPDCNAVISGPNPAQLNRNIGLHRRAKHGYRSPTHEDRRAYNAASQARKPRPTIARLAQLDAARAARWAKYKKQTPEDIKRAKRLAYQAKWRKLHPKGKRAAAMQGVPPGMTTSQAMPCKLDSCPNCGARFWITTTQQ